MTLFERQSDAELLRIAEERAQRRASGLPLSAPAPVAVTAREPIGWPLKFTLPWSLLISDDRKYGVVDGKLILTREYRGRKDRQRTLASRLVKLRDEPAPADYPLVLVAAVWLPDNRAHDVANFAKCTHDALEGVVYTKDRWLKDVRWYEAGIDVDAPRAELTIYPRG